MASVSNAFDALQGATFASSKKKKRKNKRPQSTNVDPPAEETALGPRVIPSAQELESQATATAHDKRLELWEKWATELLDEAGLRRGPYVDEAGKPTHLRTALLDSRAFELLAESCVDVAVMEDEGNLLYRLLKAVFLATEAEVLQQFVLAVVKVSALCRGKGPEVVYASKRALRDVVCAIKRTETHGDDSSHTWMKKSQGKNERSSIGKKPHKPDKKAEMHEALEVVKSRQGVIDEMDDTAVGSVGSAAASRSVSDLQVAFSLATRPSEEVGPSTKKGKKNKNKSTPQSSPMLESLKHEEAAYAAEEAHLNEEITNLEMKLKSLRSQLTSLHVSRQHVQQRKDAILQSLSSGQPNGAALISPEEQNEAISSLEAVVGQLQSAAGQSEEQKRDYALGYIDSLEKFFSFCFSRQEDLMKTVKFLKDSIQRRMEQEEKMREISSAALTKDILRTQQHSKHELEQQLRDAMFDSGDLILKVTRVDTDLKQRADFVRRYVSSSRVSALETAALQLKDSHQDIRHIAEEKREMVVQVQEAGVKESPEGGRKRIDTKEIIKQEESKARAEIAAKLQPKAKKSISSQGDPFSPQSKSSPHRAPPHRPEAAPPAPVTYAMHPRETEDPRFHPMPEMGPPVYTAPYGVQPGVPPPHQLMPVDPEVYHPVVSAYPPPGPVQRPPPAASSSSRRMAWKKIEDQPRPSEQPDLLTPGEARKQGKL